MLTTISGLSLNRQLGALEMEKREVNEEANEEAVEHHFDHQKALRKEAEEAVERAKKEAEEAAFWSDVAQVAQVAAVVGGVVAGAATGGGGLALGLAIAGGVGTLATQTEPGQDLLHEAGMNDEQIKWTGVAAAAVSVSAGFAAVASAGAAATTEAAKQAAKEAARNAATFRAAGLMTAGAGGTVGGLATYGEGAATSRQTEALADEQSADRAATETGAELDELIATAKHDLSRHQKAMSQIRQLQKTGHETLNHLTQRA